MGVSRSGYYDYEKRVALDPDTDHQDLVEMVRKISESSDHTYGARLMSRALKALGYEVGRRRARTLMRGAGIWVRYRKKDRVTTNSRLACDALQMAIWTRRPEQGLMFHSDRGVQYASHDFRRLLKANGILGA